LTAGNALTDFAASPTTFLGRYPAILSDVSHEDQFDVLHTRSEVLDGRSIPAREGEKNNAGLSRNYHVALVIYCS
jgi:hypothetical protein